MEPVVEQGFDVSVDRAEVLRLLGAGGRGSATSATLADRGDGGRRRADPRRGARQSLENIGRRSADRVEREIETCMRTARELIRPAGIYLITAGGALPGSKVFAGLERVAAVCESVMVFG